MCAFVSVRTVSRPYKTTSIRPRLHHDCSSPQNKAEAQAALYQNFRAHFYRCPRNHEKGWETMPRRSATASRTHIIRARVEHATYLHQSIDNVGICHAVARCFAFFSLYFRLVILDLCMLRCDVGVGLPPNSRLVRDPARTHRFGPFNVLQEGSAQDHVHRDGQPEMAESSRT